MPETQDKEHEEWKRKFDAKVAKFDERVQKVADEYETAKGRLAERGLDYSDEDIRMLSASINTGIVGVFSDNKDLAKAIELRRKIDQMELQSPRFKYNIGRLKEQLRPYFPSGDIALGILAEINLDNEYAKELLEANRILNAIIKRNILLSIWEKISIQKALISIQNMSQTLQT